MSSDADPNGASGARGFAGLRDLAAPVSPVPPLMSPATPPVTAAAPPKREEAAAEPAAPAQDQGIYQGPAASKGIKGFLTPRGKLVAGCLVVGAIIWAVADEGDNNRTTAVTPAQPYVSTAPAALTEVRPPTGTDVVLSSDELYYCFSESVRLDGAKGAIDQNDNDEIDLFNAMVDDYNNRCGHFRYETGTLEPVRAQVAAERSELLSEGAARFQR